MLKSKTLKAANSQFVVLFISYLISQSIEIAQLQNSLHFIVFSIYLLLMTALCSLSDKKSIMVYGVLTFILMLFHIPLILNVSDTFSYILWHAPLNLFDLTIAYEVFLLGIGCYDKLVGNYFWDHTDSNGDCSGGKNSKGPSL